MTITEAHTIEHFAMIEDLARRIVPDFYAPFFERATAEYLVESGHTAAALAAQKERGYRHYLIEAAGFGGARGHASDGGLGGAGGHASDGPHSGAGGEGRTVGYFSLAPYENGVLLSHFYVLPECRGKGLGQLAMEFIDQQVAAMGARRIELFVLRENVAAVGLYRKNGFAVAEEVLTQLGNGAVLEDYLMRKDIDN
jgi:ribosomal protein S18 acetylase RimI-like enzyme